MPHKEAPPASTTSPLITILNLILLITSLSLSALFTIFYLYPNSLSDLRWLWSVADFKAKLTSPALFLLLNLVVGALALTSELAKRNKPHEVPEEEGDLQDDGEIEGKEEDHKRKKAVKVNPPILSSLVAGKGLPPKPSSNLQQQSTSSSHLAEGKLPLRKLSRSNSENGAMAGKNNRYSYQQQQLPVQSSDQFAEKKKTMMDMDGSPQNDDSLRKASSAASSTHGSHHHDGDGDEVDRKAEDFIVKFYQQMKMQRLESMKRYKERMDRSYGV